MEIKKPSKINLIKKTTYEKDIFIIIRIPLSIHWILLSTMEV